MPLVRTAPRRALSTVALLALLLVPGTAAAGDDRAGETHMRAVTGVDNTTMTVEASTIPRDQHASWWIERGTSASDVDWVGEVMPVPWSRFGFDRKGGAPVDGPSVFGRDFLTTGIGTDIAIQGRGFFRLRRDAPGMAEDTFTRTGNFVWSYAQDGMRLETRDGYYVAGFTPAASGHRPELDTMTPIEYPAGSTDVQVSPDGSVSVVDASGLRVVVGWIQVAVLDEPLDLVTVAKDRFRRPAAMPVRYVASDDRGAGYLSIGYLATGLDGHPTRAIEDRPWLWSTERDLDVVPTRRDAALVVVPTEWTLASERRWLTRRGDLRIDRRACRVTTEDGWLVLGPDDRPIELGDCHVDGAFRFRSDGHVEVVRGMDWVAIGPIAIADAGTRLADIDQQGRVLVDRADIDVLANIAGSIDVGVLEPGFEQVVRLEASIERNLTMPTCVRVVVVTSRDVSRSPVHCRLPVDQSTMWGASSATPTQPSTSPAVPGVTPDVSAPEATAPTPVASSIAEDAPAAIATPAAAARPTVRGKVTFGWLVRGRTTKATGLVASGMRRGTTVRVTCRGGGCPSGRRLTTTAARLDLGGLFARASLRPGAIVTVQLSRSGEQVRTVRYLVRSGRLPLLVA